MDSLWRCCQRASHASQIVGSRFLARDDELDRSINGGDADDPWDTIAEQKSLAHLLSIVVRFENFALSDDNRLYA